MAYQHLIETVLTTLFGLPPADKTRKSVRVAERVPHARAAHGLGAVRALVPPAPSPGGCGATLGASAASSCFDGRRDAGRELAGARRGAKLRLKAVV